MDVGFPELLIVLAVVLLLFGPGRLPGVARSLGEATRALRDGARGQPTTAAAGRDPRAGSTTPPAASDPGADAATP